MTAGFVYLLVLLIFLVPDWDEAMRNSPDLFSPHFYPFPAQSSSLEFPCEEFSAVQSVPECPLRGPPHSESCFLLDAGSFLPCPGRLFPENPGSKPPGVLPEGRSLR